MKCDACNQVFCKDHIHYAEHQCATGFQKDVQVPVCPLCNKPVPVNRGELPDIKVGEHIDNDCQSDPAKAKRKIYTNKCSMKGCKQKELVRVSCDQCHSTYCLKHRHQQDHNCKPSEGGARPPSAIAKAGAAAMARFQKLNIGSSSSSGQGYSKLSSKSPPPPSAVQGMMSEDEAYARAVQLSLQQEPQTTTTSTTSSPQETEDMLLAQALAASEQEYLQQQQREGQKRSTCTVA